MPELQIEAAREEHKFYPYTGIFFANRHSFWAAGQDSWTLPPTQNPDLFISLQNVEPVLQGILQRRRGYTLFNVPGGSPNFQHSYSFRSELLGLRRVVFTAPTTVLATDEGTPGNTVLSPIFTPSGSQLFTPRMVLSRDYGYFADGTSTDLKKWNGKTTSGNLTNWGIDVNNSTGGGGNATQPPNTAASDGTGSQAWATPNNALTLNGVDSVLTLAGNNQTGDNLKLTNYMFTSGLVPNNATITKIIVNCTGFVTSSGGFFPTILCQLLKAGTLTGQQQALYATLPHGSNGSFTFTFTPPSWGYTWTPADIQNTNFGVAFTGAPTAISDTETFNMDFASITVVFSLLSGGGGSITATPGIAGSGNIVLLSGRQYTYAFQNSTTGHVSDIGPFSLTTGPLQLGSGQNVVLTTIPVSNDPQVDTTLILATADGNDQTTLFLLTTLANGTVTTTDNTPDALTATVTSGPSLLTNSVYLQTDQAGVIHGVANNKPPVYNLNFPIKHKGRLYGAVGRTLLFSKNLDEVTTSTGTITSRWEESWPLVNQFDISELAETITGLLSDGETLWVATERSIRRVIGDSPSNFQKPEVQFNEVGLLSQDSWRVCFMEGRPVGTMWVTPDFRVVASDFNNYLDVGTPIQDVLNSINTAAASTVHAAYVNKGPADYYMLYVPTGVNTTPDTVCVYNLRSKKWFIWTPTDKITTSLFLIDVNGAARWFFAASTGTLYEWTFATFQDRINNTPVSYPVTIQTSWLDLGDYVLRKFVNQIIPTTTDQSNMTIQVDAASNDLDFATPLNVVPATTVTPAAIPTDVFVPLASGPSHSRAFRFTFVSPASTLRDVLSGFSIEAGSFHKY